MVKSTAPSMTDSPGLVLMAVTVPAYSDSILFCIFIASSTSTTSPTLTLSPTLTFNSMMVPGRGALTAEPVPAGAAGAAGAAAGAAVGAIAGGIAGWIWGPAD